MLRVVFVFVWSRVVWSFGIHIRKELTGMHLLRRMRINNFVSHRKVQNAGISKGIPDKKETHTVGFSIFRS